MKIFRLANILSFANGITGVFAVFFAASGDYILASRLVVLAMFFDSLDGPIARWQGPTKEGKLLDRFSDRITQCIAPAVILLVISSFHPISFILGGTLLFAGLLRLIRTDAAKDRPAIGFQLSPSAFFVVTGALLGLPLVIIWSLLAITIMMSLSSVPISITPNFLRGPILSKTDLRQLFSIGARALPLLVFAVLPFPYIKIASWIMFFVMIIFTGMGLFSILRYCIFEKES